MGRVLESSITLSHFRIITGNELLPVHELVPYSITKNVCATCLYKNDINGAKPKLQGRKQHLINQFIQVQKENLKLHFYCQSFYHENLQNLLSGVNIILVCFIKSDTESTYIMMNLNHLSISQVSGYPFRKISIIKLPCRINSYLFKSFRRFFFLLRLDTVCRMCFVYIYRRLPDRQREINPTRHRLQDHWRSCRILKD